MNHPLSKCFKKILSLTLSSLMVGIFIGTLQLAPPAQADDVSFEVDFGLEEAICDAVGEDGVVSCTDDGSSTSFTDFTGEYVAPSEEGYAEGITTTSSAREFVVNVTNFILSFLGLAAIVVVIYGGVLYITAGGEAEKATKGTKTIMYAMIGIVIVLISYALVNTLIKGATGGEDEGGLYSSNEISSESLSEFQSAEMAQDIKDLTQLYLDQYSAFVNTASILDAMAKVGYFNDDGLHEMKEGLNLILDQVDPFSDTADEVNNALDIIERYVSMNAGETLKTLVSQHEWMEANVILAQSEDTYTEGETTAEDEWDACMASCGGVLDLDCFYDCAGEAATLTLSDPYGVGADFVIQMFTISWVSLNDFEENIKDIKTRLEEMQESFTDLTAINNLFDTVLGTGYLEDYGTPSVSELPLPMPSVAKYDKQLYTFNYVNEGPIDLTIYVAPEGGSGQVGDIVNILNQLYTSIKTLQFTTAVITANTDEGNAPLTVTLDGLKSSDPSNLTIPDENYEWDLDGDGTFGNGGGILSGSGLSGLFNQGSETSATTTKTYDEPGTYRVGLRVTSNTPETIASGVSYLSITVNPPSSIIRLDATISDPTLRTNSLKDPDTDTDLVQWVVTQEVAQAGITFDASRTTDGSGNSNTIISYDFNFGDGDYQNGENPIATHVYTQEGNYNFVLEVTDQNGVKDRSMVTIKVKSPAAYMDLSDLIVNVGDEVTADGGGSLSDNGNITNYSWLIQLNGETVYTYEDESGSDELKHSLLTPGLYTWQLTVTDSIGETDTISQEVMVESTPPEAVFSYDIPNSELPNRVYFDSTATQDPDPDDTVALTYEWTINTEAANYSFVEGTTATLPNPVIDFYKTGDFNVTLTARDPYPGDMQKSDTYESTVTIKSLLGIQVETVGDAVTMLQKITTDNGITWTATSADVKLNLISNLGISYTVDWADGSTPQIVGVTTVTSAATPITTQVTHTYTKAGTFSVNVTVYDVEGKSNTAKHNVYIGSGEAPIAIITVSTDSYTGVGDSEITGNRTTSFTFDCEKSVDKTGASLSGGDCNWNFGDNTTSGDKKTTHTYSEIGTYEVTLTVNPAMTNDIVTATLLLTIEGVSPVIYGLTAISESDTLVTPVTVKVIANAEDPDTPDKSIMQYKFWYYDITNSSERLGTQISYTDTAYLTVNTNGETGEKITYGFGVEVTDNEYNTVSSESALPESQIPTLEVENGPNQAPEVQINADRTNVLLGESATFTASATDEDGDIVEYMWDFEGDGFYNNEPGSVTMTKVFDTSTPGGIEIRVKVTDDGGATAISDPIKIYVDTLTQDPEAAFTYTIKNFEVTFTNNSTADTENGAELVSYVWDFNTKADSDGNGVKDDDSDSTEMSPVYTYPTYGTYTVKLTVADNEGNTDEVTQEIKLIEMDPPEAAFTYETNGLSVTFTNNSKAGAEEVEIASYVWDFNTKADSDGNGVKDDDTDSTEKSPAYTYSEYESYTIKLTITDSLGRMDEVTQTIKLENPVEELVAYLNSSPEASQSDNKIHITGTSGNITFSFSSQGGVGDLTYWIDKNVYFDSDGDGTKDNDHNDEATSAGSYATDFDSSWGPIVVKLTVEDEQGNTDSVTREIKFDATSTTTDGQTSVLPVTTSEALYILLTALGFTLLGAKLYTRHERSR